MPEIFTYDFMQKAFITGILIAVITPCIGVVIVLKRLSVIGDALSHNSLAGVAAGLIAGINPVVGAVVFSTIAALSIEKVRRLFPQYSEIATAVIMATGIGLAGVLSGFVGNSAGFGSFLFGSIVTISTFELYMVVGLSLAVILAVTLLYKELFYMTFDEESARLAGIPVNVLNIIFTLLTAITVAISSRTVGTLIVSSLMVLPVAAAMQIAGSYRQIMIYSVIFALISTVSGLLISFYANLRPGGTIVLFGAALLVIILAAKHFFKRVRKSY